MISQELPTGFRCYVANIGIKDDTDDFVVVASDTRASASGVFTKSRFSGPSVILSRAHVRDLHAQALVVISKNANVANGSAGDDDANELVAGVANQLGINTEDVLVASTGVIGRRYPVDRVRAGVAGIPRPLPSSSAHAAATAIMTTDTVAKVSGADVAGSSARVVGIAKGVGMIEPDMATMIAAIFTDAAVEPDDLDAIFRRVVDRSFNCVSIDTDTSTSDTAVVLANGAAGAVDLDSFETALAEVCTTLTKMIASDGEGAEHLIEVVVDEARDDEQAKRVAKIIVNSPLVKTAVHGSDPNWGRVAMAIGKCSDDTDIDQNQVTIRFGTTEVYPGLVDDEMLEVLSGQMDADEVLIHVSLGIATGSARVWGCDLSDGYVRINADYTT